MLNLLALVVRPTPKDARVRIMNIVPRYQAGMELDPGRFDIDVSRQGYQRYRQWHDLTVGEKVLAITLEPLASVAPQSAIDNTQTTVDSNSRRNGEPQMVRIKGGCFQMGSPTNEIGRYEERERQHRVCVDDVRSPGIVELVTFQQKKDANASDVAQMLHGYTVEMNKFNTLLYRTVAHDGKGGWTCVN